VRRQIVEHVVSGPRHGGCRFPIEEQHSGAEHPGRRALIVRIRSEVGDRAGPRSRREGGRRALEVISLLEPRDLCWLP